MSPCTAPVNRIISLSTVDGPGARCAVFLQGCNLTCAYCHNPETQQLCDGCGQCVATCPAGALREENGGVSWDGARCVGCDACIACCPHNASPKVKHLTAAEVFAQIERVRPILRGITVSGGECSLYGDFLRDLFALARGAGLSCLMDSNGMMDYRVMPELMELCDGVMLDVKAWDREVHRRLAGAGNDMVKQNLRFLSEHGKLQEVRLVCLEPEVDVTAVIQGVAGALGAQAAETPFKLIRFRPDGVRGPLAGRLSPTDGNMARWRTLALAAGLGKVVVV